MVLDEPVSALDVSIQAGVINLLNELKAELGLSYLFVAHDLAVVRHIADRVAVMYLGRIVEIGAVDEVFGDPRHPYTEALLSAMPAARPAGGAHPRTRPAAGDLPSPTDSIARLPVRHPVPAAPDAVGAAEGAVSRGHSAAHWEGRPGPPRRMPFRGHDHVCIQLNRKAVMRRIVLSGLALAATASLALSGCTSGGSDNSPKEKSKGATSESEVLTSYNPQPASNLQQGGKMTLPIVEIPDQLNPLHGDGSLYTSKIAWFYQPQLSFNDPKGNITYNQDYLTDVKQATVDGNTQVTYDINPQAKWNDGQDMDWTVFRDTWAALNGKNKEYVVSSTDGYSSITSVKQGKDAKQAIVTFNGPFVYWKSLFTQLVNPHIAKADAFNKAYVSNPHAEWGAGPYTISKFDAKGGIVSYKPNPKWWGEKAHLDEFTFVQMEVSASLNAFKNGQIDAVQAANAEELNQVKSVAGTELRRGTTTSNNLLVFNSTSPQLKDPGGAQGPDGGHRPFPAREDHVPGTRLHRAPARVLQSLPLPEGVPGQLRQAREVRHRGGEEGTGCRGLEGRRGRCAGQGRRQAGTDLPHHR